MPKSRRNRVARPVLDLPDLEQSKSAVLNSLASLNSRRAYEYAIREFTEWYLWRRERGIRKLEFPIEPASCRLAIAAKTTDAILAKAACPMLPDGPTEVSSWDVLQLGRTKELA
jgi:hypothetical protein